MSEIHSALAEPPDASNLSDPSDEATTRRSPRRTTRRASRKTARREVAFPAFALLVSLALAGVWLGAPQRVQAQVESTVTRPIGGMSIYGLASCDNRQYGYPHTLGYSGGIDVARNRLWAMTAEGSAITFRASIHDYTAMIGPRIGVHVHRLTIFGGGTVGLGHAGYVNPVVVPHHHLLQNYGLAYGANAGLEVPINRHFVWRVVQANYTRISTGPGVATQTGSTGFVFRFY